MSWRSVLIFGVLALVFFEHERVGEFVSEIEVPSLFVRPDSISDPPEVISGLATEMAGLAKENPARSRFFVGFFQQLSVAVESNPGLIASTLNVQQLMASASRVVADEADQYGKFPESLSVAANKIIETSIGTLDDKNLTDKERENLVVGLLACEWAIRKGASQ